MIDKLEIFTFACLEKIKAFVSWAFYLLRVYKLKRQNHISLMSKYVEIDTNEVWIIRQINPSYYPRIGFDIQNDKDKNWFDTCSITRLKRDFKQIGL